MLSLLLFSCWSSSPEPSANEHHFDSFPSLVLAASKSDIDNVKSLARELSFGHPDLSPEQQTTLGGATGFLVAARSLDDAVMGIEATSEFCAECHAQTHTSIKAQPFATQHAKALADALQQALTDESQAGTLASTVLACGSCHQPQGPTAPAPGPRVQTSEANP